MTGFSKVSGRGCPRPLAPRTGSRPRLRGVPTFKTSERGNGMKTSKWLLAGALATALCGVGCEERPANKPTLDNRGTGGSGYYDSDGKRIGDGKIGNNNGV